MRTLALALLIATAARAEIVDRIVATVGRAVITDSMVRRSLRATALLARTPLRETPEAWEETRNRIIEQALVKEEIRISRYPVAQPDEVRASLEQVRAQLGGDVAYLNALREYRLTEDDLTRDLGWRLSFARFLAYRFRPAVQITDEALLAFYSKWTPEGVKPPFEEARERVEAAYAEAESVRFLDQWLRETRQQTRIETFEPKGARR